MKTLLILLSLAGAAMICAAELPKFDVLNVGTKTYRGVKVTAIEPSGIRFTHESGAARAKFEELEPDVRSKFTFDPAAAKQFEADRAHQMKMAALSAQETKLTEELVKMAKQSAVRVSGRVLSVTDKGVLLTDAQRWRTPADEPGYNDVFGLPDGGCFIVCGTRGIVDGHSIDQVVYPRGTFEYPTALGGRRKVKCFTTSLDDYMRYQRDPSYQPK